jgi:hypothetical protein
MVTREMATRNKTVAYVRRVVFVVKSVYCSVITARYADVINITTAGNKAKFSSIEVIEEN